MYLPKASSFLVCLVVFFFVCFPNYHIQIYLNFARNHLFKVFERVLKSIGGQTLSSKPCSFSSNLSSQCWEPKGVLIPDLGHSTLSQFPSDIMGDALKEKRSSKKLAKDPSVAKSKASSSSSASPNTSGMPGPVPIDNPAFDKLHTIQKDWAQREWIETVNGSMKRIVDFLNKFDISTRYRLASLNQKLTALERQMDYLESQAVGDGDGQAEE